MKSLSFFLAVFSLLVCQSALGQFSQDRFYTDGGKIFNLAMQSVEFDGDSVFTPYYHWSQSSEECYTPDATSLLGNEIRVSVDGIYRFVLADEDTLQLFSEAELGETWLAWTSPTGDGFVRATVSAEEEVVVMGESESVKTISLQMLNESMEEIEASVNFRQFKFAEESGLVSFPVLLKFPESHLLPSSLNNSLDLVSIGESEVVKDLTTLEVYDFQVGDEFHMEEGESFFGVYTLNQYAEKVLSKLEYADSTIYELEIKSWTYEGLFSDIDPQPVDTVIEIRKIVRDSLFDSPAGTALVRMDVYDEVDGGTFTWLSQTEFGRTKNYYYGDPMFIFEGESEEGCYQELIDWGCMNAPELYIENLGGPYFSCDIASPQRSWRELIYFNKGGEEWGEPLSLREFGTANNDLSLYPNPATDEFTIQSKTGQTITSVKVYDLQGRLVKSFDARENSFNVSELNSGLYRLLIEVNKARYGSLPLVVK